MPDASLISRIALSLAADESQVEKDWHIVRAVGVIASVRIEGVQPIFSGGTSLAKGWGLIKRFSEDIDFKVAIEAPTPSAARTRRSKFREAVIGALGAAGFALDGEVLVGNMSRFFRASFQYGAIFEPAAGIRPTLQIEMTFGGSHLDPAARAIQSFIGEAERSGPEIAAMLCVDPVETAADKLSALAWRTHARDRKAATDDPTIVRHLHDLAALSSCVADDERFVGLARAILENDASRSRDNTATGLDLVRGMLPAILGDRLWRTEYEQYVHEVGYGPDAERIGFDAATAACAGLVKRVLDG